MDGIEMEPRDKHEPGLMTLMSKASDEGWTDDGTKLDGRKLVSKHSVRIQ